MKNRKERIKSILRGVFAVILFTLMSISECPICGHIFCICN